jgi:hypothetical protein
MNKNNAKFKQPIMAEIKKIASMVLEWDGVL